MRLDKWLAQYGGMSRSEATKAIRRKQVTIDGAMVNSPNAKISQGAVVELDGVSIEPPKVIFHKPIGLVTTSQIHRRPCVGDWLPHRIILWVVSIWTPMDSPLSTDGALTQHLLTPNVALNVST